jgi:hypothetical protein
MTLIVYIIWQIHPGECVPEPDALYGYACQYKNTWIQFQIMIHKLNKYAGSWKSRYIQALNWAIPTMTLFVVGDVFPVTERESTYVFVVLFAGVTLNGLVVGNIISLVSNKKMESEIEIKKEILTSLLARNNVDNKLLSKVSEYMKFIITDDVQMQSLERSLLTEIPFSLQVSYIDITRAFYLRRCPFFDFCSDDVIRNLALHLKSETYGRTDIIISFGDIGSEMYFIQIGKVEVSSLSKFCIYLYYISNTIIK